MPVLANAEATQIDRLRPQQLGVTLAFLDRQQRVALQVVKYLRFDQALHPLAHAATETRRMTGRNAQVFVHVKERDLRPVHAAEFDQSFEKFDLRIARGKDCRGAALGQEYLLKIALHLARRLLHQVVLRGINTHPQRIDDKVLNRLGHALIRKH